MSIRLMGESKGKYVCMFYRSLTLWTRNQNREFMDRKSRILKLKNIVQNWDLKEAHIKNEDKNR